MSAKVKVTALDHIVLNVADVERSLAFYVDELGLEPMGVDAWREGKAFFPSVRVSADTIIDLLYAPDRDHSGDGRATGNGRNVDHFCLVIEPVDLAELKSSGSFAVVSGPAQRSGARGTGTSLYVEDPDGNTIELRHY